MTRGRAFFPCCQAARSVCHPGVAPDESGSSCLTATHHGSTPTRSRQRVLHSREKELIYNINKYFSEEKACNGFIIPPSKAFARTAKATNVSEKTV